MSEVLAKLAKAVLDSMPKEVKAEMIDTVHSRIMTTVHGLSEKAKPVEVAEVLLSIVMSDEKVARHEIAMILATILNHSLRDVKKETFLREFNGALRLMLTEKLNAA